ncbi:GNAT family N-acetyltransferase [Brevundimonas aurifodinae]|uniref:GNAT family N-acetyltransferase n=2 Tax=Brevundimonas TaxID=41275 RepID=A0ABV1NQY4_9CAUL
MPGLTWRAMTPDDLDAVSAVAAVAFPNHFEDRACFANRLSLHPQGCRVLADETGLSGYIVAYPWRRGRIPPLNSLIDAVPDDADLTYLHDLALLPETRGAGHARIAIEALASEAAAAGWPALALVAVNDAEAFWTRHGFVTDPAPDLSAKLATYGPDARYMVRPL